MNEMLLHVPGGLEVLVRP